MISALDRQRDFWDVVPVERPLTGVFMQDYLVRDIYRVAREGELLSPDSLKAELFFDLFRQRHDELTAIDQDLIRPVEPINAVPWLEGILGMEMRVFGSSIWAEPLLSKTEPLSALHPTLNATWLDTTTTFVKDLVDQFHPNMPIAGPFLRGPTDVVVAMIGAERFCVELIDQPEEIERLLLCCAQTWVDVYKQVLDIIPEWNNGYVPGARWIHAPGECVYSSEDACSLISPAMYRRFILPVNQYMASHFPYGFVHRHSDSIQHIDLLLDMPSGWAIEVTVDPTGPSISRIASILARIQDSGRPLILFGLEEIDHILDYISRLSSAGLCVIAHAETPKAANQLSKAVMTGSISA